MLTLFLCPPESLQHKSTRFGSRLVTIFKMAEKTKENGVLFCFPQTHLRQYLCVFICFLLPDWSVFLAGLGYDKSDGDDKAVFDVFNKKKITPGELAGLWTDLGANEVKNMLSKWVVDDDLAKILSGIKELVPKGLLSPVYYPILCLF